MRHRVQKLRARVRPAHPPEPGTRGRAGTPCGGNTLRTLDELPYIGCRITTHSSVADFGGTTVRDLFAQLCMRLEHIPLIIAMRDRAGHFRSPCCTASRTGDADYQSEYAALTERGGALRGRLVTGRGQSRRSSSRRWLKQRAHAWQRTASHRLCVSTDCTVNLDGQWHRCD